MTSVNEEKRQLRRELRAVLEGLPVQRFVEAGQQILPLLVPFFQGPVALFASRTREIDTTAIDEYLNQQGIPRWYPAICGDHLEFREATGRMREWPLDRWGIPIPPEGTTVSLSDAACVLVPGLAFDRQGGRLGYGKGYYDRALEGVTGPRIGIALPEQVVAKIPMEAHDRRIPRLAIAGEGVRTL